MIKLDRSKITFKKIVSDDESDDGFIIADPSYLVGIVTELTKDAWAFKGEDAEQRLQRNITNIYRREC